MKFFVMLLLQFTAVAFFSAAAADSDANADTSITSNYWVESHENLTEYELVAATTKDSVTACLSQVTTATAVTYKPQTGQCLEYRCSLGIGGCRKCRSFANSTLPLVWLKLTQNASQSSGIGCWRTFQHRVDASIDFYRNWTQYVQGFGQGEEANFWLGLNNIHNMTKQGGVRVRWEFSDWNGKFYWAENEYLRVEGEASKFRASIGSLDASRSSVGMNTDRWLDGMQFTTFDQDNDLLNAYNCAWKYTGAWWYKHCHSFNPNGKYFVPPQALNLRGDDYADGIAYYTANYPLKYEYSLRTFESLLWQQL